MDKPFSDNPGDCRVANAVSTTITTANIANNSNARRTPQQQLSDAQQQVNSTTTTAVVAVTATPSTGKSKSPTPPPNKLLKAQQQQQTQQHYQFRTPQQFVRHKRTASTSLSGGGGGVSAVLKKNKTWSKRNYKLSKQNVANFVASSGGQFSTVGCNAMVNTMSSSNKADLENIQNIKNQISNHRSGGGGGIVPGGNNGTIVGGVMVPSSLKQQIYKKTLTHRGHHHHVLCAGAAHNTLGNNGVGGHHHTCCLLNGCSVAAGVVGVNGGVVPCILNGKDTSASINGGNNNNNSVGGGSVVNSVHYCCGRSKFFLPEKRIRKEVIVPPTKFLLGGNISDPLNLNSLQNETSNASSNNNTPATTPRQSPFTTPPKVEVIIPPNIHDPLHLLDPVDSMEYEKQLTSPMKRGPMRGHMVVPTHLGGGTKHRHRKNRKPKRRRYDSSTTTYSTSTVDESLPMTTVLANSTLATDSSTDANSAPELSITIGTSGTELSSLGNGVTDENESVASEQRLRLRVSESEQETTTSATNSERLRSPTKQKHSPNTSGVGVGVGVNSVLEHRLERNSSATENTAAQQLQQHAMRSGGTSELLLKTTGSSSSSSLLSSVLEQNIVAVGSRQQPHVSRDLCLDLSGITTTTCYGLPLGGGLGGTSAGSRKRKVSESNNSQKSKKFHRHDAMDKIVSPVVPQPGAWKRPPRMPAMGARKPNTRRSTSFSEAELPSPVDSEIGKPPFSAEVEMPRDDTPDYSKAETASEAGVGSPLSTISGTTSLTAGGEDSLADNGDATNLIDGIKAVGGNTTNSTTAMPDTSTTLANICKMPKFRPDGAKYRYGNFDRYADFRQLNEFRDVRLQVFQRHVELFQNKDILDIGCNVGHMTLSVARNLAPKSILGIDIDRKLIGRARRNLSMYVRIPEQVLMAYKISKNAAAVVKADPDCGDDKQTQQQTAEGGDGGEDNDEADGGDTKKHKKTRRKKRKRKCSEGFVGAAASVQQAGMPHLIHQQHNHHHQLQHLQQLHLLHHHHHHHYHVSMREQRQQQKLRELHVPAKEFFPISFPLVYGSIPSIARANQKSPTATATVASQTNASSPTVVVGATAPDEGDTVPIESNAAAVAVKCEESEEADPTHVTLSQFSDIKRKNNFPQNVFFRHTNYVLKDEALLSNDTQQYDLILCLSVTKWIHLNFGDTGLKLTFKRMFNQLRPGGKLILEAQNWASYKKKKNLTPEIYKNYKEIEFFPNKFHEYLLSSEVGFSHSYTLGVPRHLNKGFCRPIQLYAKGDYTPNHVRWSDAYCPETPYVAYRGIYATMPPRVLGSASGGHMAGGGSSSGGFGYSGMQFNMSSTRSQPYDTPHYMGSASGSYSCRQTPMHQPTSQYYNPLETDSYQPSYDMEYLNHMYVFASPLYQTVWSPPASLRKSSSHTPVFGSVRDAELDGDGSISGGGSGSGSYHRHVYPPNDDTCSPNANAGNAFNSIRDPDTDDSNQLPGANRRHVYATNCGESSSSPQVNHHADVETIDEEALSSDDEPQPVGGGAAGGSVNMAGTMNGTATSSSGGGVNYCDLNDI